MAQILLHIRHAVWLSTFSQVFRSLAWKFNDIQDACSIARFTTHKSRPSSLVRSCCCGQMMGRESFKKMPETTKAHMKIVRRRLMRVFRKENSQFWGRRGGAAHTKGIIAWVDCQAGRDQQLNNFASKRRKVLLNRVITFGRGTLKVTPPHRDV